MLCCEQQLKKTYRLLGSTNIRVCASPDMICSTGGQYAQMQSIASHGKMFH
jgi:hypothetical protein